ncbi:MAG: helix-turn-helix transcriptional regulator [Ruminococcaceae bacterium]|nr:helix-turn-helix transcriptional regulator [Oscillospiraceae bacterium]
MENLKNLRLKKGYSQAQLADFLKIGAAVVARWEKGLTVPTAVQVINICYLLNCKPAELYLSGNTPVADCRCAPVPVFDGDCVYMHTLPAGNGEAAADFGIVLPCNTAERLYKGDICFFVLQKNAEQNSIVLTSGNGFEYEIAVYDSSKDIIAVCTAMHRQM